MNALQTQTLVSPVYVIGGFLGSGKTTLLKRLLKRAIERGVKPGVLMNEFGEADVDGASLCDGDRDDDIELKAILNGCMCCDLSGTVDQTLRHLLEEVKGAPVFIETTGLASTGQVLDSVRESLAKSEPGKAKGRLASSVVVVDTPRFEAVATAWSEGINHLRHVDTVILNKMDGADGQTAEQVERRVRQANPDANIVRATFADIAPEAITESIARAAQTTAPGEATADSTAGFRSLTVRILYPIDVEKLKDLLGRYRASIVRAKGFVRTTTERGIQEIQWVPGALTVTPYRTEKRVTAHLVVIGRRVPWNRFFEQLDKAVPTPKKQRSKSARPKKKR
ncbi:MAG: hypothetical protein FJ145_00540 [Deltaproteobacteria bacterium]|nr:hypothetical protein [Deltaproteobacteria bacterium]